MFIYFPLLTVLGLFPVLADGQDSVNSTSFNGGYSTSFSGGGGILRIGYLFTEVFPPFRAAAMNLAIRQGQADGLLPGYNISIVFNVTGGFGCDVKGGMFDTMYMLGAQDVDALFGPVCSSVCASIGYMTSYWNVIHFPEYCADSVFEDKTTYNTMIRIGGSNRGLGIAVVYYLNTYKWRRLALLTDIIPTSQCNYAGLAINNQISSLSNMSLRWIRMLASPSQDDITDYLKQAKLFSRIVFFCHNTASVFQQLLFTAQDMGMTDGDYVFLSFNAWVLASTPVPWTTFNIPSSDLSYRIKAFYSLKMITFMDFNGPNATDFLNRVRLASVEPPWYRSFNGTPSAFAAWLYDSVYLYMTIVDRMLRNGFTANDIVNGSLIFQQANGTYFEGVTGNVLIDTTGDRLLTYTVWTFGPQVQQSYRYMQIDLTKMYTQMSQVVSVFDNVNWGILGSVVPPDTPSCGFLDEFCPPPDNSKWIIIGCSVGGVFLLVTAIATLNIRSRRAEAKIQQMLWKIDCNELVYSNQKLGKSIGSRFDVSMSSLPADDVGPHNFHTSNQKLAKYRGNTVAVYNVEKAEVTLTRRDLVSLVNLKELNHVNIKAFVGACVEPGHICYVMNLCTRGSIQDVIEDESVKLDWLFRMSLISDLINGMLYIHRSVFQSHGNLTSANCHIDNRWVLKIGGFGLEAFSETHDLSQIGDYAYYRELLWTAPELLRMKRRPFNGTQKGDVYSFAIVVQEIAYRAQPYFCDNIDPKLIFEKISNDTPPFYRPALTTEDQEMPANLVNIIKQCWTEQPAERPSFDDISKAFRHINNGRKVDIVDNMLKKMEKYAENLEDLVRERTSELEDEKLKTDMLLYRMLPKFVAEELMAGRSVVPQLFPTATIYFSDIVGFTTLSSESTPLEVVDLLNDLYGTFDDIISRHDVYKVETIGDAYMVVSGLPKPNGDRHICEICNMALDLLAEVDRFVIRHRPNEKLMLRIGIHSGPCAAGVVGHAMPRYCLFGDTVNVASRMESTGEALKIHLSEKAHKALVVHGNYETEPRGETFVKGKGMLPTFWLLGKDRTVDQLNVTDLNDGD